MTINLPAFDHALIQAAAWVLVAGLLWSWLRPALTPDWVAQLLESEKTPSIRLTLAAVVVVFCLSMDAAGRLTDTARTAWLGFAEILLALGVAKVAVSRFAPKPTIDPTEQSDSGDQPTNTTAPKP